MNFKFAPIALFCYNRLDTLIPTVTYLQNNHLAIYSTLYVFSDGPKDNIDKEKIYEVRKYLNTINGFKKVIIVESKTNQGLSISIINGINNILKFHESVIVLEDDLITRTNNIGIL